MATKCDKDADESVVENATAETDVAQKVKEEGKNCFFADLFLNVNYVFTCLLFYLGSESGCVDEKQAEKRLKRDSGETAVKTLSQLGRNGWK